jgi:hypothetical protein
MTATSLSTSASCSVDALERVVHFSGAGADACFYTNHVAATAASTASTASLETLRYWLNPSARARPTTATCEITNLGAPFFSATSSAQLRVFAAPLFRDARCFPRRCVLSLATSAQRLDGVSLRPVVIKEWNLVEVDAPTLTNSLDDAFGMHSTESRPYTTTIPLRTLFHLASLMSSSSASTTVSMDDVRLYLQLRFTGCTDASDTHRIAMVRFVYEGLGPAVEVLPVLQRRHKSAGMTGFSATSLMSAGGRLDGSTFVEEVEVTITSGSSSSEGSDGDEATPCTPPRWTEKRLVIPAEGDERECASPPHRSATKPRAEKSSSVDRGRAFTLRDLNEEREEGEGEDRYGGSGAALLRVERALRLPPPPPPLPPTLSGKAPHDTQDGAGPVLRDERPPLRRAPCQPRKTRTIVLAPSISPSLSSASDSGSPLSSPGSGTGSTPRSRSSSVTCDATLPAVEGGSTQTPLEQRTPLLEGARASCAVQRRSTPEATQPPSGAPSSAAAVSTWSPPPRQLSETVDASDPAAQEVFPSRGDRPSKTLFSRGAPYPSKLATVRTNAAVLWAATSLLGTAPWKLRSLHSSRRGSPAASAPSSRASSRDRDGGAPVRASSATTAAAAQPHPSVSFLSPSLFHAPGREVPGTAIGSLQQPPVSPPPQAAPQRTPKTTLTSNFTEWRDAGERSTKTSARADTSATTVASIPLWRSAFANESSSSSHVSPHLHPPRNAVWQASSAVSSTSSSCSAAKPAATVFSDPPSAYVPRLSFRTASRSKAESPPSAPQQSSVSTAEQRSFAPLLPPSRNKNLWARPVNATATAMTTPAATLESVVAEYGQPFWQRTHGGASAASSLAAPPKAPAAEVTASTAGAPVEVMRGSREQLSVIPTSWLQSKKVSSAHFSQPRPADETNSRQMSRRNSISHAGATAPTAKRLGSTALVPVVSLSPSSAFLVGRPASSAFAAPTTPPPPSPPPPRSRMLFHDAASSFDSSRSDSPSVCAAAAAAEAAQLPSPPTVLLTQRNNSEAAAAVEAPALLLQELRQHPRHQRPQTSQRRSRSAPDPRQPRPLSTPSPPPLRNEAAVAAKEAHVFAVLKHHASRNGVGRRRLTIRPVTLRSRFSTGAAAAANSGDVRCFVALEKVHGVAQLRHSIGLGVKSGNGDSAHSSCEVPIMRGDAIEVWTGAQALNSGVIHKDKVHRAECCLVIRCNGQLVTAAEMETVEAVDTVARLLLAER